jgi:polygalacturonase
MYLEPTGGLVDGLKVSQPIAWNFALSGKDMTVRNVQIEALSDNPWILPFNTDGFDVSGENILVENAHVVNGDDCLTLSNGATNIEFRDSFCANGHGVSIGSLETNALVQNFTAENIYVQNALYGARFKAWLNGNGVVENILYKNFYVDNCTIPIFITQSYYDQETSSGSTGPVYQSIDLIKFNFTGFRGTINGYTQYHQVDPSGTWWDVPGLTGRDAIVMECPTEDACAGLHFSDIDISADWDGSRVTEVWCENGDNATLGFNCVNGTLVMN